MAWEILAEIHADNKARVMQSTWGHLAPKRNKIYRGRIVFAVGCYGNAKHNPTILLSEFNDLDDSPWFFEARAEFLSSQETNEGCVYEFIGMFRNYRFEGVVKLRADYN